MGGALYLAAAAQAVLIPRDRVNFGLAFVLFAAAGAAFAVAAPTFPRDGDGPGAAPAPPQPLHQSLLLGGMALGTAALLLKLRGQSEAFAFIAWGAGMVVFVLGFWQAPAALRPRLPRLSRHHLALAAVLVLAFLLRAVNLPEFPPNVDGDEAVTGMMARRLLQGEEWNWLGTAWMGFPSPSFHLHAMSMYLLGDSLVGLRMASVVMGVAAVGATYALGNLLFGRSVALLSATVLATAQVAIHFSRIGLNNIQSLPLFLLALYFWIRGLREGRHLHFALGGVTTALCLYSYYAGRLVFVYVALLLGSYLLARRRQLLARAPGLAVAAAGFHIAAAPLVAHYLRHPETFWDRQVGVWLWSNVQHTFGSLQVDSLPAAARESAIAALKAFNWGWDHSPQYHFTGPALDVITAPLFVLGLALVARRAVRDPRFLLLALLFWVPFVLAGWLTVDSPSLTRFVFFWPAIAMTIAVAVHAAAVAAGEFAGAQGRVPVLGIGLVLAASLVANIEGYFMVFPVRDLPPTWETEIGRAIARERPTGPVYFVSGGAGPRPEHDVIRYFAKGIPVPAVESVTRIPRGGGASLVVLMPDRTSEISLLETQFPGGAAFRQRLARGGSEFLIYRLAPGG